MAKSGYVDLVNVEMFWGNKDWNASALAVSQKLVDEIHAAKCLVFSSRHKFATTPSKAEMVSTLNNQQSTGADIPKTAVMPVTKVDVLTILNASYEFASKYADRPFLIISIGSKGMMSRIACELSESCMTFGAADQVSAPGQIQMKDLKEAINMIHME